MNEEDRIRREFDEFDVSNHFDNQYNPLFDSLKPGELNCMYNVTRDELERRFFPSIMKIEEEMGEDYIFMDILLDRKSADNLVGKYGSVEDEVLNILISNFLYDQGDNLINPSVKAFPGKMKDGREVIAFYLDAEYS